MDGFSERGHFWPVYTTRNSIRITSLETFQTFESKEHEILFCGETAFNDLLFLSVDVNETTSCPPVV